MTEIPRAEGRHAFGDDPAAYAAGRPGYPRALWPLLGERCGIGAATRAFEIGPGTGQATAPLLALGLAELVAVEPDPRLAAWLRAAIPDGRLTIRTAAFENAALPPARFDLGVSATAFHWLEPAPALAAVRAALVPGGWWAMWWNSYADPARPDPFRDETQPLFDALGTATGRGIASARPFALDRAARLADLHAAGFVQREAITLERTLDLDAAGVRALYATFSQVRRLDPDARDRFLDALAAVVDTRFGGRVARVVLTPLYLARRPER